MELTVICFFYFIARLSSQYLQRLCNKSPITFESWEKIIRIW